MLPSALFISSAAHKTSLTDSACCASHLHRQICSAPSPWQLPQGRSFSGLSISACADVMCSRGQLPSFSRSHRNSLYALNRWDSQRSATCAEPLRPICQRPNPPEPGNAIWRLLSRYCVSEASDGSVTHLSRFPGLSKLPNAAWEQLLPNMRHLLWFTPVILQSASLPHQTLVNRACLPTPELSDFLNAEGCNSAFIKSESSAVIGQAEEDYNCNYEALLLHALDDSANDPDFAAIMPTYLLTDGALQNVSRLVDSSSWLLKTLKKVHSLIANMECWK